MAAVLKLVEDGVTVVDFVASGSDYALRQDGLTLGLPEVTRVTSGGSTLGEGQRLIERHHGNREIEITFNIKAATHNALVSDIRAINRLLDAALKNAREGLGKKIALHYKLDDADDEVVFDVLDGSFVPGQIADPTVRRSSHLRDCTLTLLCEPYARLTAPIAMTNQLVNGSFEIPLDGATMSGSYCADLGTTTDKYIWESYVEYYPLHGERMAGGIWVYWPSQQSAQAKLMQVGIDGTETWLLELTAANKLQFTWWSSAGSYVVTAPNALSAGAWHFVGFCMFTDDGLDNIVLLQVDDTVVGMGRTDGINLRATTEGMWIGRGSAAAAHFNGKVCDPFVIVGQGIQPFQLDYIRKWGVRGLCTDEATYPNVPNRRYWGLERADVAAVWSMHYLFTTIISDVSGNGRHAAVEGSPTIEAIHRRPAGWTVGADWDSSGAAENGLYSEDTKWGTKALRFAAAAGSANFTIEQTVDVMTYGYANRPITLVFWYKPHVAGKTAFVLKWDTITKTVDAGDDAGWRQFIFTRTGGLPVSSTTVTLQWTDTGNDVDVLIDNMELIPEIPFGNYDTDPTDITDSPVPYVGDRFIRNWPSGAKTNFLEVYGIPGDVPATCRLIAKNDSSAEYYGPIRIGAQFGGEPWKHIMQLRACQSVPVFAVAGPPSYDSGQNPDVILGAGTTLIKRVRISLSALFPHLGHQHGSFKLLVGMEGSDGTAPLFELETVGSTAPLTGDPQEDPTNGTFVHPIDVGILTWPPASAYSYVRDGEAASGVRAVSQLYPSLTLANWAGATKTGIKFSHVWFVPIDGGSYMLTPLGSGWSNHLRPGEALVVDTIDEDAAGVGYVMKNFDIAGTPTLLPQLIEPYLPAAVTTHGTGFFIPPNEPGHFYFMWAAAEDDPGYQFGRFDEADTLLVSLEYMPRFLYV